MSIEYKDITKCEKLSDLPDGSYIAVIADGEMKLITKENAKFGEGATVFTLVNSGGYVMPAQITSATASRTFSSYILQHSDGTEVTAQEVYDAYMAGSVRIRITDDGEERFDDVYSICWCDDNGESADPSNVVYVYCKTNYDNFRVGIYPEMEPES